MIRCFPNLSLADALCILHDISGAQVAQTQSISKHRERRRLLKCAAILIGVPGDQHCQ